MRVRQFDGHVDAIKYYKEGVARGLHEEVDSAKSKEVVVTRAFGITPAEMLLAAGYVRRRDRFALSFAMNDRLGLGGTANFQRLSTGEWLYTSWTIRTPPDELRFRFTGRRSRIQGRTSVPCFDAARDCKKVFWPWPRLVTNGGLVTSVHRDGKEIYSVKDS
jgi:hypothetical protein